MIDEQILQWAYKRGLLKIDYRYNQFAKVVEELGELSSSMIRMDNDGMRDALGDVYVTLVILAWQLGFNLQECVKFAYEQIKDRHGELKNGNYIKSKKE